VFFLVFSFIFGLITGSFLNSVIYRLEKKESFVRGRSYCPNCKHTLSFLDLVPLLSFILLKGKCRYCKAKISLQYPLVELSTGFLFLFSALYLEPLSFDKLPFLFYLWFVFSLFLVIFVFDLKYLLIPDSILNFGIFSSSIFLFFESLKQGFFDFYSLFLSLLPSLFFLFLVFISKENLMGFGDFKLSVFLGLFLGWQKNIVALFFAFFAGAIFGIFLIIFKKKSLKSKVPFGPFLISGAIFSFFFDETTINFYLNLFLK
jgi:leader peptidase (prepilin peptidase) / N-methyltransferase